MRTEHGEFTLHAEAVLLLQGRDDFAIGQAVGGLDDDVLRELVLSLVDDGLVEGEVQEAFVRLALRLRRAYSSCHSPLLPRP